MKTLTKQEAVAAFMRGEKVELSTTTGKWSAVTCYSYFDVPDTQFRLAATDDDAEWLRGIIKDVYGGNHRHEIRLTEIANRIERDKARIAELESEVAKATNQSPLPAYTYASEQATECAGCGKRKHTPLRNDEMGGYVCLTCIDKELERLQSIVPLKGGEK